MDYLPLVAGIVITLICAWLVHSVIRSWSGYEPGSILSVWWDFFSKMGGRGVSYAEPLPDLLKPGRFSVGDNVRVVCVPLNADHSVSPERQLLLERCIGKVLRVERIDEFGALELHVLRDGTQAPDRFYKVVLVEPQYVEPVTKM